MATSVTDYNDMFGLDVTQKASLGTVIDYVNAQFLINPVIFPTIPQHLFCGFNLLEIMSITDSLRWRWEQGSNTPGYVLNEGLFSLTQLKSLERTLNYSNGKSGNQTAADPAAIRALVRAGSVTSTTPLVGIGDSHTDYATSASNFWDRLTTVRNQVGEGFEGVAVAAFKPMGNNGQTLSNYLAGGGTNTFTAAMALNPSVVLACWLTNDVRLGGLGLTISSIKKNGAALLNQLVANIKASKPGAKIILRIPTPFMTVDVSGFHYITDGVTVNPTGLAQTYTSGVRAAHYEVLLTNPDVYIYDPQVRMFGLTSPTAVGTEFADQIHQSVNGYAHEADDFANWINAMVAYDSTAAANALVAQQYTPWLSYSRIVEDTSKFVQISYGDAVVVTATNTFFDYGPTVPGAPLTAMAYNDIVQIVAGGYSFMLSQFPTCSASGANTRIALNGGQAISASVVPKTKVRTYRQITSGDSGLNAIITGPSTLLKLGRITAGSTAFMDITAASLTATNPTQTASAYVPLMRSGDKVYVESRSGSPITLTSNFSVNSSQLRITGLSGFDYSTMVGRLVVVYRP